MSRGFNPLMGGRDRSETHISRRKFLGWGMTSFSAAAIAGSSLLAACAERDDDADDEVDPLTEPDDDEAPVETDDEDVDEEPVDTDDEEDEPGEPRAGGSIVMAVPDDWTNLDPHSNAQFAAMLSWEHTYQSLVTFDEEVQIVPALATSWDIPDPQTFIFHLREGVLFHNGDEFTADDVVYWHERLFDPETSAPYAGWFNPIEEVEVIDSHTVQMNLSAPYSPLLANLASMRGSAIVPRNWAADANLSQEAVGTGPYRITDHQPQSLYRWERNDDYWDEGLPNIDRADNTLMLESSARLAAMESGAAQYTWLSEHDVELIEDSPDVEVLIGDKAWYVHLQFNTTREPFDDSRVRRAVALAIDHEEIIENAAGGYGVLTGPVPTGHTDWYIPVEQLSEYEPYSVDLDRARELLEEAGYPDGFQTTWTANSGSAVDVTIAQIVQERLRQIDIEVEINQVETTVWVSETQPPTSNYEMRLNINTFYPDADGYLYNHYHSEAPFNQVVYHNDELDELVTQARQLIDHEERRQIYYEVQDLILAECVVVPLYNGMNIEAISNQLQGYRQSYTGRRLFFPACWLEES